MTIANVRLCLLGPLVFGILACSGGGVSEPPGACLVVRRVDQCCSIPFAASVREVERDPCLQHWERSPNVTECPAAQRCSLMTCPETFQGGTWTRVAEVSGTTCRFAHECTTDADCALASDRYQCCSCPQSVPTKLVVEDACYGDGETCDSCTDVFPCDACPSASTAHCSEDSNGLRKCFASE